MIIARKMKHSVVWQTYNEKWIKMNLFIQKKNGK